MRLPERNNQLTLIQKLGFIIFRIFANQIYWMLHLLLYWHSLMFSLKNLDMQWPYQNINIVQILYCFHFLFTFHFSYISVLNVLHGDNM